MKDLAEDIRRESCKHIGKGNQSTLARNSLAYSQTNDASAAYGCSDYKCQL